MSDALLRPALPVLRHADALAAWVLLGWLGMRLGWSVASGVLPVVIWWSVRSACQASGRPLRGWGVAGLWLAMLALAGLPLVSGAPLGLLLVAAGAWGVWSAALSDGHPHARMDAPRLAMGLMMGSLWLSSQWCLGPGWTDGQAVALHLGLMTGLPLLVLALERLCGTSLSTVGPRPAHGLLLAGALLMAMASGTAGHVTGMLLLVLAGTLTERQPAPPTPSPLALAWCWVGPALLLGVGWAATRWGPGALQAAWSVVALLALAGTLPRSPFRQRTPPFAHHHWRDAS
jgi:hypothetical protein